MKKRLCLEKFKTIANDINEILGLGLGVAHRFFRFYLVMVVAKGGCFCHWRGGQMSGAAHNLLYG